MRSRREEEEEEEEEASNFPFYAPMNIYARLKARDTCIPLARRTTSEQSYLSIWYSNYAGHVQINVTDCMPMNLQ
jgi:hypothetical protein